MKATVKPDHAMLWVKDRDVLRYREDAGMLRVWYECSVPAGRCHCYCEPGEGGCDE